MIFRGCRALRADTLRGVKTRLPEAVAEVRADSAAFKDLYRFTFRFGLEGGQKALPVEMAVSLWLLVFSHNEPPLLSRWVRFLQVRFRGGKIEKYSLSDSSTEIGFIFFS